MNKVKLSKFEQEATALLEGNEDVAKQVASAYRKAKSKINSQIAQLQGKEVELEEKVEQAKEDVKIAQYSIDFDLQAYDNAQKRLEDYEDDLKAVRDTLENRKELLTSWE